MTLQEGLRSFQHFLVESDHDCARNKVFSLGIDDLNARLVEEKFDPFFHNLKCAAKVNLAFAFIFKYIEDWGFRYFYAHENNTLLDRSNLVCTRHDMAKLKDYLKKTDVVESCSREMMHTKKAFYNFCFTQRHTYGLQGRCLHRTSAEEQNNQLPHVWRKYKTTIKQQLVPL